MKKRMIFLLWLLGGVGWLMVSGCKKQKDASGQILEFGTEKPIVDATLTLRDCEGEVLGNFSCTDVATTQSDADGNFGFDRDGTVISGKATGYYDSGDDFAFINRKDGCPVPATLHLYPFAWLKVYIKNESGAYSITRPGLNSNSTGEVLYLKKEGTYRFIIFIRGNNTYKYIFSCYQDSIGTPLPVDSIYILNSLGTRVYPNFNQDAGHAFELVPNGHDTTKISITY